MPKNHPREMLARAIRTSETAKHEEAFALQLRAAGLLQRFQRQFRVLAHRKYAWDFAAIADGLLIEIQGQIWRRGGHTTGYGISRDAEKLNLATVNGWKTLIFTPEMIADGRALRWTEKMLSIQP